MLEISKTNICIFCFIMYIFCSATIAQKQKDYYTESNILKFADYLFEEGDFLRAAGEYLRYLFHSDPSPDLKARIFYSIGLCYRNANNYDIAISYFQKVTEQFLDSQYYLTSYIQTGYLYFLQKNYESSIRYTTENLSKLKGQPEEEKAKQLLGLNHIFQQQWVKAREYFQSITNDQSGTYTKLLFNLTKKYESLPRKSKVLAGLMSSIVPGAGKVYGKRTLDGITSFILCSLSGWQAYQGFKSKGTRSTKGWVWGSVFSFFYFGNIYGSIANINIHNRNLERKLVNDISVTINANFSF